MRSAYGLRDAIFNCRAPLVVAAEFPPGYKNQGNRPSVKEEMEAWGFVFKNRWGGVVAMLREYDARSLEAEAIWGVDARTVTQPLSECVSTLYAAIESYMDDLASEGDIFRADRDFAKKVRSEVFASRSSADNELNKRIASALDALADFARPNLRHV